MVTEIITSGTKPRWLSEKYLSTLDEKFQTIYKAARIKFRLAWAEGQQQNRIQGHIMPTTKKLYTDLGTWLIKVYDTLSGADKLDSLARIQLEKKVYEWTRANKPETCTEDFKDWEYNNKFITEDIDDPLTKIMNSL